MKNLQVPCILVLLLLACINDLAAQTQFQYNFYNQNPFVYNPAFTGQSNSNAFVNYRQQWIGFEGAPRTALVGAQTSYAKNSGLGLMIMNNRWGILEDNLVQVSNSYGFRLSKKERITMGLSVGLIDRHVNFDQLNAQDFAEDVFLNQRIADLTDDWNFVSGFGITYSRENFTVALSSPSLYNTRENNLLESQVAYLAYNFSAMGGKMQIMPSTLIRGIKDNPTQFDINVRASWKNLVWLQPTYRSSQDIIIATGINYESINFGYAFELMGTSSNIASNSHEITVGISFGHKKKLLRKLAEAEKAAQAQDSLQLVALVEQNSLTKESLLTLQEEIKELEAKMGGLTEIVNLNNVDTATITYEINSIAQDKDDNTIEGEMKEGHYVVVNTCTSKDFALHLTKLYSKKGIKTAVAFNKAKKYYYVHTEIYDTLEVALKEMKTKRKQGFKNAWVMVYKN